MDYNIFTWLSIAISLITVVGGFAVFLMPTLFGGLIKRKATEGSEKRTLTPLSCFIVCFFLGCFILFLPAQYVEAITDVTPDGAWRDAILSALYSALRIFIIEGDTAPIVAVAEFVTSGADLYYWISLIYFFVGPILTASFVISFMGNLAASIRYFTSTSNDVYYISELNERSIELARSIYAGKTVKNPLVLFFDVKEGGENPSDMLEKAKAMGCICFAKEITDISYKPGRVYAKRTFFYMSEDEDRNVRQALTVLKDLVSNRNLNTNKNEMYVFATSLGSEALLDTADNGNITVRRVNEKRNLVLRTMLDHPVFDRYLIEERDGESIKKLNILIVGYGQYGRELLKAICWCCQVPGYEFSIKVIDKDENIRDIARKHSPDLIPPEDSEGKHYSYDIEFYGGYDIGDCALFEKIKELGEFTTVYVTLGEDEANLNTAIELSSLFARENIFNNSFRPTIYPVVYSPIRNRTFNEAGKLHCFDGNDYLIELIGDMSDRFSIGAIEHKDLEADALRCHLYWSHTATAEETDRRLFEKYEYHRRSSMARAVHLRILDKYGIDESKYTEEDFKQIEHARWEAYMRAEGFTYKEGVKDFIAKIHRDLKPFTALGEQDKEKDKKIRKED